MSTLQEYMTECAVCGKTSRHRALGSVSQFGEADLDGRPAPMVRSSLSFWADECPQCGYTNATLDLPCSLSRETLRGAYSAIATHPGNNLAFMFGKYAWLLESTGSPDIAVVQLTRAAWACDDNSNDEGAVYWRKRAAELAGHCLEIGKNSLGGTLVCLRADLLRRAGDFGQVSEDAMGVALTPAEKSVLAFQLALAAQRDADLHNMEEVPGYTGDRNAYLGPIVSMSLRDAFHTSKSSSGDAFLKKAGQFFNTPPDKLFAAGPGRAAGWRRLTLILALRKMGTPFTDIARMAGAKDHTQILYALEKAQKLYRENSEFSEQVEQFIHSV